MRKDLLFRWRMNLRFRPLKQVRKIQKQDDRRKQQGQPTSIETKVKQALIFTLTQIGAFKRALNRGEDERN